VLAPVPTTFMTKIALDAVAGSAGVSLEMQKLPQLRAHVRSFRKFILYIIP
jgi:hypothetical protein